MCALKAWPSIRARALALLLAIAAVGGQACGNDSSESEGRIVATTADTSGGMSSQNLSDFARLPVEPAVVAQNWDTLAEILQDLPQCKDAEGQCVGRLGTLWDRSRRTSRTFPSLTLRVGAMGGTEVDVLESNDERGSGVLALVLFSDPDDKFTGVVGPSLLMDSSLMATGLGYKEASELTAGVQSDLRELVDPDNEGTAQVVQTELRGLRLDFLRRSGAEDDVVVGSVVSADVTDSQLDALVTTWLSMRLE